MEQATETKKTTIRPNVAGMTKTIGGSYHKPDFIGDTLAGLTVVQVALIAAMVGLDPTKYAHLNPGQQRMTLGNSLRKLTNIVEVPEIDGKPDQKTVDKNEATFAVREKIEDKANELRAANIAEKTAAAQAKADAKAAKAAAAVVPPVVGENAEV